MMPGKPFETLTVIKSDLAWLTNELQVDILKHVI